MKSFAALVIALFAFANTSEGFSAAANSRVVGPRTTSLGYLPTARSSAATVLEAAKKNIPNDEKGIEYMNNVQGMNSGLYLGAIVLALNIWLFSVPTEFRRTRICSEADTAAFPEKCMTREMWTSGIKDYYKNGGGIKFDLSINPNPNQM